MRFRYWMSAAVLMTALLLMVDAAAAFDDSIYPDLKGQWRRAGNAGLLKDMDARHKAGHDESNNERIRMASFALNRA